MARRRGRRIVGAAALQAEIIASRDRERRPYNRPHPHDPHPTVKASDPVAAALEQARASADTRPGRALTPILAAITATARSGTADQYREAELLLEAELVASGRYALATRTLLDALALAEARQQSWIVASLERRLGSVYDMAGDDVAALELFERARDHFAALGDREGLARSVLSLGVLWTRRRNLDEARQQLDAALLLADANGSPVERARVRANLGYTCELQGDYARGREVLEQSLAISEPIAHPLQIIALLNLARIDLAERDAARAAATLRRVEPMIESGNQFGRQEAWLLRGRLAVLEGRYDDAVGCIRTAIRMADELGAKRELHELWEALASAYEAAGDYRSAFAALRQVFEIDESLRREQAVVQVATAAERRAAEKAQHEAELARASERAMRESLARLQQAQADLRRANEDKDALLAELHRQTREDPLTKLLNRRALDDELERECARAGRHDRPLSVVLLDIDHFKRINDEHSHETGDAALVALATCLAAARRQDDIVARLGGEEFVLLLPETLAAQAVRVCEDVQAQVASYAWHTLAIAPVTVSFGVAQHRELDTAQLLLGRADQAMYSAKQRGRNRIELAAPAV